MQLQNPAGAVSSPALDELVDSNTAARVLSVSVAVLEKWRARGVGPKWLRIHRMIRYRASSLSQFMAQAEQGGAQRGPAA